MKNILRVAVGVALVLGVAASMQPALANCAAARGFGSLPSHFTTPGGPFGTYQSSPDLTGTFWSFAAGGGGNPTLGVGRDGGALNGPVGNFTTPGPAYAWINPYGATGGYIGSYLGTAHWQTPGSDGCIDDDGAAGCDNSQCMVIQLTDDDQAGHGFFAVLAKSVNPVGQPGACDYDFSTLFGGGNFQLAPIPKPEILGSVRNGINSVDLSVRVSLPAQGFFLGCTPAQNTAIQAATYRVYQRQSPNHGSGNPNPDRARASWGAPVAGPIPVGQTTTVTVTCGGVDADFFLCSTLQVPTGNGSFFEFDNCSRDALTVECGPNLAEPQTRPTRTTPKGAQTTPTPRGGR